jgi:hypothetical protein
MPRCYRFACALALALLPGRVYAQDRLVDRPAFFLGTNVLVGGLSAFANSFFTAEGPDFGTILRGAAGGAITWGGQRLIGTGETALRLPGLEIAALGANVSRNAGERKPVLSDITLPFYPFYLRFRPESGRFVTVRVSAMALAGTAYAMANRDRFQASLDWKESVLSGAPVFRSTSSWIYPFASDAAPNCRHGNGCDGAAAGVHRMGVTWYTTGGRSAAASHEILTHETIHLSQAWRDALLFALPANDAMLRRAGTVGDAITRFAVVDAFLPIAGMNALLAGTLPPTRYGNQWRFYELEARALSGPGRGW